MASYTNQRVNGQIKFLDGVERFLSQEIDVMDFNVSLSLSMAFLIALMSLDIDDMCSGHL